MTILNDLTAVVNATQTLNTLPMKSLKFPALIVVGGIKTAKRIASLKLFG